MAKITIEQKIRFAIDELASDKARKLMVLLRETGASNEKILEIVTVVSEIVEEAEEAVADARYYSGYDAGYDFANDRED